MKKYTGQRLLTLAFYRACDDITKKKELPGDLKGLDLGETMGFLYPFAANHNWMMVARGDGAWVNIVSFEELVRCARENTQPIGVRLELNLATYFINALRELGA